MSLPSISVLPHGIVVMTTTLKVYQQPEPHGSECAIIQPNVTHASLSIQLRPSLTPNNVSKVSIYQPHEHLKKSKAKFIYLLGIITIKS